jgi:predicted small lipoprotein YifL
MWVEVGCMGRLAAVSTRSLLVIWLVWSMAGCGPATPTQPPASESQASTPDYLHDDRVTGLARRLLYAPLLPSALPGDPPLQTPALNLGSASLDAQAHECIFTFGSGILTLTESDEPLPPIPGAPAQASDVFSAVVRGQPEQVLETAIGPVHVRLESRILTAAQLQSVEQGLQPLEGG